MEHRLDLFEFVAETEREGLELEVRVLAAGDLVLVDVGVAALHRHGAFERRVQLAGHFPVSVVLGHVVERQA